MMSFLPPARRSSPGAAALLRALGARVRVRVRARRRRLRHRRGPLRSTRRDGDRDPDPDADHPDPDAQPHDRPRRRPRRPRPTPAPPEVVDGPNLAGLDVQHCPGTVAKSAEGQRRRARSARTGRATRSRRTGRSPPASSPSGSSPRSSATAPPVPRCRSGSASAASTRAGWSRSGPPSTASTGSSLDYTWHESLPRERHEVDTPVAVQPGDRVWAQVRWLGGSTLPAVAGQPHPPGRLHGQGHEQGPPADRGRVDRRGADALLVDLSGPLDAQLGQGHRSITSSVTVGGVRSTLKADGSTRVRIRLASRTGATRAIVTSTAVGRQPRSS